MPNVINRALVVNPYPLEQHALEDIIQSTNQFQHIHFAVSPAEAYRIVSQQPIAFVMLEVEADDASGLDILRRLRAKGFAGKILFISAIDKRCVQKQPKSSVPTVTYSKANMFLSFRTPSAA